MSRREVLSNQQLRRRLNDSTGAAAILAAAPRPRPDSAPALLILCAALSGVSALTLELLWGRELALAFGSFQYAVATVLAAFMLGLGLGSFLGAGSPIAWPRPPRWRP